MTLMKITPMTRNQCLARSMVLPGVELLYMSPPPRRGGIRGMVKRLNTCFKVIARYSGRRRHICVRIVLAQIQSELKCGYDTLRQTVPVLHSICIAHMTFSDKFIIIKSCFYTFFNAIDVALLLIKVLCFFVYPTVFFLHTKCKKNAPRLRLMAASIEVKSGRIETRECCPFLLDQLADIWSKVLF